MREVCSKEEQVSGGKEKTGPKEWMEKGKVKEKRAVARVQVDVLRPNLATIQRFNRPQVRKIHGSHLAAHLTAKLRN